MQFWELLASELFWRAENLTADEGLVASELRALALWARWVNADSANYGKVSEQAKESRRQYAEFKKKATHPQTAVFAAALETKIREKLADKEKRQNG